ncbi:MAG: C25 family cysteine peptidase [Planctomycetota bacterium]
MKKLLLYLVMSVLLPGNLFAGISLQPGKWLIVTKAVDGPSNYDLDFLAAVAASSALTDGEPAVLAITNPIYLFSDAWHADYVSRYNPESALIVGQNIPGIPGVSQLIVLNSVSAGAEQAKEIATTVWAGSDQVVICSLDGNYYENALTAASLASRLKVPLLYSSPSTPGDLDTVLAQLGAQSALVVGSPLTLPVPSSTLPGAVAVVTWLRNNGHSVDYLAAVNPADRDVNPDGSKLSLVSTILAARRGGVVVPVQNAATYLTVRDELRQCYAAIGADYYPEFLAIVATTPFIPFGEVDNPSGFPAPVLMTDALYAEMDADPFLEIAVGRVIANNFSEGSLIASRISTYDSLKDRYWENRVVEMGRWGMSEAVPVLNNFGYVEDDLMGAYHNSGPPIEDGLILHYDHSAWWELGFAFNMNMNTLLAPAFILSRGCSTAALDEGPSQITKRLLRQGAVGFMGGTRSVIGMSGHQTTEVVNSIVEGESLGHAFNRAYEALTLNVLDLDDHGSDVSRHNWLLIGDPGWNSH